MSVVEEYWSGVSQRLQAEVDVINRLVKHNAEMGRANEIAIANILEGLLPSSLGVGTGVIIDHHGGRSLQTDIIVFDQGQQPQIMAQTTQLMFPVESVIMALEVKTTLDAEAVEDAGKKAASIRILRDSRDREAPTVGLFAYNCAGSPITLGQKIRNMEDLVRPDFTCITNPGVIGYTGQDNTAIIDLVPLHKKDETGARMSGQWEEPPADHRDSYIQRDQSLYPITRLTPYGRDRLVCDPGRTLLLFCNLLLNQLERKEAIEVNWLTNYLSGTAQETLPVVES